jgi:leader peptidase (prepilin peptidase)/N-methyltransferase
MTTVPWSASPLAAVAAVLATGVAVGVQFSRRGSSWWAPSGWPLIGFRASVSMGIVAGVLASATVVRFGLSWLLPAHLFIAALAVMLTAVDLGVRRLPNVVVLPAVPITVALLALGAWSAHDWGALISAALAGIALFSFLLLCALVSPASVGMGDVKLALVVGTYTGFFGWTTAALSALLAFVAAAVLGLVLLASRRIGRGGMVPFGPSMFIGALISLWVNAA